MKLKNKNLQILKLLKDQAINNKFNVIINSNLTLKKYKMIRIKIITKINLHLLIILHYKIN